MLRDRRHAYIYIRQSQNFSQQMEKNEEHIYKM